MNDIKLIQPALVERDKGGNWYHPDLPPFDEGDGYKYCAWVAEQKLETCTLRLEDEDENHPAVIKYFDKGDPDCREWNAEPPPGEGWFTLAIGDTEDGPCWCWVRRVEAVAS